ncbi:MAG: DUF445 family protein [Clostridia bacterium]|nr:DUF445 family protein [Clostridia bacterium]
MDFQMFIPPLVGGVIGYITNDIAIKMLFHPRKAMYIGKWQLPFTPGLIPKEKHRVAKSIGNVISTQLLNSDTLVEVFTSEKMLLKIRTSLESLVENNKQNEDTLEATMLRFAPEEVVERIIDDIKCDVASLIHSKLTDLHFGENISKHVLHKINDKMHTLTFGLVSNLFDETLTDSIAKSVGELINKAIFDNSEEIVQNLIETEVLKLKEEKVCDIILKYEEKIPVLIDFIINTYEKIIKNNLAQILNGINIAKIVEEKIDSFDVMQLEDMIFGIMSKELKAIVYLGAVLGFIMGFINLLI